jgi:hypothetical protein
MGNDYLYKGVATCCKEEVYRWFLPKGTSVQASNRFQQCTYRSLHEASEKEKGSLVCIQTWYVCCEMFIMLDS